MLKSKFPSPYLLPHGNRKEILTHLSSWTVRCWESLTSQKDTRTNAKQKTISTVLGGEYQQTTKEF